MTRPEYEARLGSRASRPRGGRGEGPTRARCPRSQAGAVDEPRLGPRASRPRNSPQHPRTRPADGTPALPGEHRGWHSRGYLPHFDGAFVTQAITFNLFDAIPARVIAAWKAELDITEATPADDPRHVELRGRIAQYEDQGHGSCFMRDARIADLVEDALLHFDGERYRLLSWCVMPNHVHAIAVILDGHPLDQVVFSWKSFTAKAANKLLGRTGRFWMPEYFDRYIRDQRHFDKAVAYVEQNPVKAGLCTNPEGWPWSSARRRLT